MDKYEEAPSECKVDEPSKILVVTDEIMRTSESLHKAATRIDDICDRLIGVGPDSLEKAKEDKEPSGLLEVLERSLQRLRESESRIHRSIDRLEETRVC